MIIYRSIRMEFVRVKIRFVNEVTINVFYSEGWIEDWKTLLKSLVKIEIAFGSRCLCITGIMWSSSRFF